MLEGNKNYLHDLLLQGKRRVYARGEVIESSETRQRLSIVKSGFIKRYIIRNDGTIAVQVIYGPGDVFSITFAQQILLDQTIYHGPETIYYEAMDVVVTHAVDGETLKQHADKNPAIYKDLFEEAGRRLQSNIQMLENLSMKTSYHRVAHQLLYYANHYGEVKSSGVKIKIPLTHQDLASILSLTRETVTNSLIKLREEGLVGKGRTLTVCDVDKLQIAAFS